MTVEGRALRVCTWNIHAWGDATGRGRVDDVICVLREINADVVVLNEVLSPGGPLLRLGDVLDKAVFFGAAAFGGNAVLAPPGSSGRALPLTVPGGEARSAVVVDVARVDVHVVGVHLDHRHEAVRCAQLRRLLKETRTLGPFVVAGDLNAVDTDDYEGWRLAEIETARVQHGLEPSKNDIVAMLREAGAIDAVRAGGLQGPLAAALQRTCWAGTRVDHVWLDRQLAARAAAVHIDVVKTDASDHQPVVVDLTLHG